MSNFKLNSVERRVVIICMVINSFALFVNEFELQGKMKNCFKIFTNEGDKFVVNSEQFYPFVDFTNRDNCFNGIFPYYDSGEFFVYTILIFGIIFIKKVW